MTEIAGVLKQYGGLFGKGLLGVAAPAVAKGFLIENLKGISVKQVSEWVTMNKSLWGELNPQNKDTIKNILSEYVTDLTWFTADWVIDSLKKDLPALASLFLGWKKASNWLERQIEYAKKGVV